MKKITSLFLSLLLILSMCAGATTVAFAAQGDMVYFEKPTSWTGTPNCYVWGTGGTNSDWPGTPMKLVKGSIYSYEMPAEQENIIFNCGGYQTKDQTLQGEDKIFKISTDADTKQADGAWSYYEDADKKPSVGATPGTSSFTDKLDVKLAAKNSTSATYSVNGGSATAYTNGQIITIGADAKIGDKITLDLAAGDGTATVSKSYTYTKVAFSGAYVYLNNEAGWTTCNVYYWNGSMNNGWPGVKLTDAHKDPNGYYVLAIPQEYVGSVIFNNGSQQSDNLDIKTGQSMIYNNKTNVWEEYDTSAVQFKKVGTDAASPQYTDTDINIFAEATGGNGDITYKFSVQSGSVATVLSDYSKESSVMWSPQNFGEYKLIIEVKDTDGNTNSRTLDYTILDDTTSVRPVLKRITTSGSDKEVLVNEKATIDITATGGVVGTNLLFYKVEVTGPSGEKVNKPYYKLDNSFSFTPDEMGTYKVAVSVQNSKNATVTKIYEVDSVDAITPAGDPKVSSFTASKSGDSLKTGESIRFTATASGGTKPYEYKFSVNDKEMQSFSSSNTFDWSADTVGQYVVRVTIKDNDGKTAHKERIYNVTEAPTELMGDVTLDGAVDMKDVILLQQYLAKITELSEKQKYVANVDKSSTINMKDVILIQQYIAKIIPIL